jgi:hypothetical protein
MKRTALCISAAMLAPWVAFADTVATVNLSNTITAYATAIGFRPTKMMFTKPIPYPEYQRVGVVTGDLINFEAMHTPSVTLASSEYSWSGVQSGTGKVETVTFTSIGPNSENLTVGGKTQTVITIALAVEPPNETQYCVLYPSVCEIAFVDASEANAWANSSAANLGGGITNGPTDAARHSYWNAIMVVDGISSEQTLGFTTAHERSGLEDTGGINDVHNAIVMDLLNNQVGASIGVALGGGAPRATVQTAIRNALAAGTLMKLDDYANQQERGLLQPTNR